MVFDGHSVRSGGAGSGAMSGIMSGIMSGSMGGSRLLPPALCSGGPAK
jgi:hypothetical protein